MSKPLVPFECTSCGSVIGITPGAAATHISCPRRAPGKAAPQYRKLESKDAR